MCLLIKLVTLWVCFTYVFIMFLCLHQSLPHLLHSDLLPSFPFLPPALLSFTISRQRKRWISWINWQIQSFNFPTPAGNILAPSVFNSSRKIIYKSKRWPLNLHGFLSRISALPRITQPFPLRILSLLSLTYNCSNLYFIYFLYPLNPPILFIYLYGHSLYSSSSTHIRYPVSILY